MIRLSSLGDVLLCAPALRALKKRFPESRVDFLVAEEFREAAELLPGLDRIITFDRRSGWRGLLRLRRLLSGNYETIVDLQNSFRSAFLRTFCFPLLWTKAARYRVRRWLLITFKKNLYGTVRPVPLRYIAAIKPLGAEDDGTGLELAVSGGSSLAERPRVILCPGAKHATKKWPVENWRQLATSLTLQGFELAVCGSQDEEPECREIAGGATVLINKPLAELATAMRDSAAVITHDSGLMHLASGSGARVLAIFGPTVEEFGFYPFRADAIVVEQKIACRPCSAFGGSSCPKGHHHCMAFTTPEQVLAELDQLITSEKSPRPNAG